MQNKIFMYVLCPEQNFSYNIIRHQTNYLLNKYKKYNIQHKFIEPKKNTYQKILTDYDIFSYPSYIIQKDKSRIVYNGTDINKVENYLINYVS